MKRQIRRLFTIVVTIVMMFTLFPIVSTYAENDSGATDDKQVHITGNSLGDAVYFSDGNTITASYDFAGDASVTNRVVKITIPRGLRIVSATGYAVNVNQSLTGGKMTPTDLNSWVQTTNSDFIADPRPSVGENIYNYAYEPSGTFTYKMIDGVEVGHVDIELVADELLYNYSTYQELGSIKVEMSGMANDVPTTDNVNSLVVVNPNAVSATSSITGDTKKYVNKNSELVLNLQESFPLGGIATNETILPIYNLSFTITYPKGAIIADVLNFTKGSEVDNGDGTCSTTITRNSYVNLTNGALTNAWKGYIVYPSPVFKVNDVNSVTFSDITWNTLTTDSNGVISNAVHQATNNSFSTTIIDEPNFNPRYTNQTKDKEEYRDPDNDSVTLALAYNDNLNGSSSYTPVRFRADCDYTMDNVDKIELFVPPLTERNSTITKVVYKYVGETETVWENTSASPMPGEVSNNRWQQAGANNNYITLTADEGKYYEYAYVEVDQINDFGFAGHNNVIYGLPKSNDPTSDYSNHEFSTWQYNETSSSWVKVATSGQYGFRWKEPTPFEITPYSSDGQKINYAGNGTAADVSLAKFAYYNTSGGSSNDPIQWNLKCDTAVDNVHTVWFPLPYSSITSDSIDYVDSVSWTYEGDSTVYTWTRESGEEFPFTTGTLVLDNANTSISIKDKPNANYAILNAEEGKAIASVNVIYNEWSANNGAGFANVWGRPESADTSANVSKYVATLSSLKADGSIKNTLSNNTQGFKWGVLTTSAVRIIGNFNGNDNSVEGPNLANVDVYAGKKATLKFNMAANPLPQLSVALILPSDLQLDTNSIQWRFQRATGCPEQERVIGATIKTTRPASAAELAQAGLTEGTVYIIDATNQDAALNYGSGGLRYFSYITFDVNVDPLAKDQVIKWSQISAFSTNQAGIDLKLIVSAENAIATTPIDGLGAAGNKTIIGDRSRTITIHKDPKLSITQGLKNSTSEYHTYNGSAKDIVPFKPGEEGTIKVVMTNTVETADVNAYDNYVFIPIGDGTSLSKESGFDLKVNGTPTVFTEANTIDSYEVKYLSLSQAQAITASNAVAIYNNATTSYDDNTNFVVIKLNKLEGGCQASLEIPIKATDIQSNETVYDEFSGISIFYFSGNDKTIFNASTSGSGGLKASYRNAKYNVHFDSLGGTVIPSQEDIPEGNKAVEPDDPTRPGYNFEGWFSDAQYKKIYDFDSEVKSDMTLYAKWTEKTAVIQYYIPTDEYGGSLTRTQESVKPATGTPHGTTANVFDGYTFEGWYNEKDPDTIIDTNTTFVPSKNADGIYEAAKYFAKFTANTDTPYTVKYYLKDAGAITYTEKESERVNATGTTAQAATSVQKTFGGFAFENKTYAKTGVAPGAAELTIAGDGSLVISYYYSRKPYKVTFVAPAEGGSLNAADNVKEQDVSYEMSPIGTVTVTPQDSAYDWLGYKYVTVLDDNSILTGTIGKDFSTFKVLGNTILTPYFAHIPYSNVGTDGNGYVAHAHDTTTAPTEVGVLVNDGYEWPSTSVGSKDAAIAFKAKDHYKVSSITIQTPSSVTDTSIMNIPLTNGEVNSSNLPDGLLESDGSVILNLTDASNGQISISKFLLSHKVTINYEKITWKVEFDTQGGSANPTDQTIDETEKANKPANPTKTGYTFSGWYTDAACTEENEYDFASPVVSNINLYAKWIENKVEINYKSNNNTQGLVSIDNEKVSVLSGTPSGATAINETGYKFINWTKAGVEVSTNETFVPSKNVTTNEFESATYQANFEPISYTITYNGNSGTGTMSTQSFNYNQELSLSTNQFVKSGYTFLGWSTVDSATVATYDDSAIVKNLTRTDGDNINLYAVWQANLDTSYTVEHYQQAINGSNTYELITSQLLSGETDTTATANPQSYEGFTVNYTKAGTVKSGTIKGDGTLVLKLYYTRNKYNVSFNMNGHGTAPSSKDVYYNATYTTTDKPLANPSEVGYTFNGWYSDSTLIKKFDPTETVIEGDTIVYASWSENADVEINYEAEAGGTVSKESETLAPVTGIPSGSTATAKIGYTFDGWYDGTSKVSSNETYLPLKTEGQFIAKTYTAKFVANTNTNYVVEYYVKNLTGDRYSIVSNLTENKTGTTDTDAVSTKKTIAGCTYDHMTYEGTDKDASNNALKVLGDGSLVIKYYYKRNTYNVEFKDPTEGSINATSDVKNQQVTFGGNPIGDVTVTSPTPEDEYIWLGYIWKDTTNNTTGTIGTGDAYKSFEVKGNTEFTPYFAHIPFSAIRTSGNGVVTASKTENPTLDTDTEKTLEYTSVGENHDSTPYNSYMKFKANEHYKVSSITIETPNGTDTSVHTIPLTNGVVETNNLPAGLLETGGTVTLEMAVNGLSGELNVNNLRLSHIIKINYEMITHTASFNTQGGSTAPDNQTINDGDKVNTPENPTRKGYTFEGWYTDAACSDGKLYNFGTEVTNDVTLYAKWNEVQITFTYISEDENMGSVKPISEGVYSETIGADTGSPVGSVATPKTGYDFVGWYKGDMKVEESDTFIPSKEDGIYSSADYVAVFEKHAYNLTIHYVYQDLSTAHADHTEKVDFKSSYEVDSPTIIGYSPDKTIVNGNMEAEDKTVTVTYIPNTNTAYTVEHYCQNKDGSYPTTPTLSESKTGTTKADPVLVTNGMIGFSYDSLLTTYEDNETDAQTTALKIAPDGSLVIKLYYKRLSYDVTYDMNGHGTQVPNEIVLYQDKANKPTDPSSEGYTFKGWYSDEALVSEFDFNNKTIENNTKLYAKWTRNEYTVSYDTDGGNTVNDKQGVYFDSDKLLPANPKKEGYTFTGWKVGNISVNSSTKYSTLVADDTVESVTLKAQWEQKEYTVIYNTAGGNTIGNKTGIHFNDDDLLPIEPTRDGYNFTGWALNNTEVSKTTKYSSLVADDTVESVTLKAQWTPKQYEISFDSQGAKNSSDYDELVLYDDYQSSILGTTGFPNIPNKPGYTFITWEYENKDGDMVVIDSLSKLPDYNIKLVAQWSANDPGNIEGSDKEYNVKDGQFTFEGILEFLNVKAYDYLGNLFDLSDLTVDENQLDVLNKAILDKNTGVYEITVTTPDGLVKVFKVTLIKDKNVNDDNGSGTNSSNDKNGTENTVDTGDHSNTSIYFDLAGFSLIICFILLFTRKKEEE